MKSTPESYAALLAVGDAYCEYVVRRLRDEGISIFFVKGYRNQLMFGDTDRGVEIKFDRKFHETGNLFIETEERRVAQGRWVPSGIYRNDRSRWYGIGDYRAWYVYAKAALAKEHECRGRSVLEIERSTSRGFLIKPIDVPRVRERFWPSAWNGQTAHNSDLVSEESLKQIGRCVFGIQYRGDGELERTTCDLRDRKLYCATHNPNGERIYA